MYCRVYSIYTSAKRVRSDCGVCIILFFEIIIPVFFLYIIYCPEVVGKTITPIITIKMVIIISEKD